MKARRHLAQSWGSFPNLIRFRISLLLLTWRASLKKSLSHISVAVPVTYPSGRPLCATDRNEGPVMEPGLYSLQAVLRGALILGLSLTVFAQIPGAPDTPGDSQPGFDRQKSEA
jgi:hypothetical protein